MESERANLLLCELNPVPFALTDYTDVTCHLLQGNTLLHARPLYLVGVNILDILTFSTPLEGESSQSVDALLLHFFSFVKMATIRMRPIGMNNGRQI